MPILGAQPALKIPAPGPYAASIHSARVALALDDSSHVVLPPVEVLPPLHRTKEGWDRLIQIEPHDPRVEDASAQNAVNDHALFAEHQNRKTLSERHRCFDVAPRTRRPLRIFRCLRGSGACLLDLKASKRDQDETVRLEQYASHSTERAVAVMIRDAERAGFERAFAKTRLEKADESVLSRIDGRRIAEEDERAHRSILYGCSARTVDPSPGAAEYRQAFVDAPYDAVADSYDKNDDEYPHPVLDALLELVGDVEARRVLDLACGPGRAARGLARRGGHVTGLDISTRMIERARRLEDREPLNINYVCADATDPASLDRRSFDVVVSSFGLSDIDDLPAVCATVRRVLNPHGIFACSLLHPCFPGIGETSASWPPRGGYHQEGWWRADGKRSPLRRIVGSNHRRLSTYVNTLQAHGLTIEQMAEPLAEPSWAAARPGIDQLPLYVVLRCRRNATE